ncbi:MAG: hypothetical protein JW729_00835 [Bacteroidales bacterium]|nr:hypothetical protein [Bacteroidales bacterium]
MKQKTILLFMLAFFFGTAFSQGNKTGDESLFAGLKMRNIGPAFTSGRIADIAIHPQNNHIWYVAVGSGGVWKTENSGVTWSPIFDKQNVYSTGCVTIDPSNPSTIWVGTGENVGGRHVGFGDGVYKSTDAGKTWKNMGLTSSEHISKILVHPKNSDIIWVAAQGPLWSSGGERGVYKSVDGGQTWIKTLGVNEWTGATDIAMDPENCDWLYAATWQRHRTVAALMGGGPGSGIYRSKDGGNSWDKLSTGLPKSNLGKIGLAVSPQNPAIVYAAVETDRRSGGVYKSTDKGSSWEKQSNTVSGATGPHYYQELYASPHVFDRLYLMDVRIQVSDDGGKTFRELKEEQKHSDNHAIAFRADDPDYLLVGTDAGIYESFDLAENWRFIPNLPITQYYKLAVNNREPFYEIFAGTQDNGSHGGPSRTDNQAGIRNSDWYKTLGADGYQAAADPTNPDIIYGEFQEGMMFRVDLKTGEQVAIQPQPAEGENFERYSWDAPLIISSYDSKRLYFASNRVWRSDDRGDSWTRISDDLTRNEERLNLPIMGKKQSWDNPWDVYAMSNYNTITAIAESPVQEGLLYAGTDDGIIQVTEDGGKNWRKIETNSLPGVPERAFVNDIKADLFDANVVYVALDNHKGGDFSPYLFKSENKGKTWKSMVSNLPQKTLVWRLAQDYIKKDLLFIGTEFGIYFSLNGGLAWTKMAGTPTIAFRDLVIQKRENDLVGASFGRGFFILDDYSALREITPEILKQEAALFSSRKAFLYTPRSTVGGAGAEDYAAENPPFGPVFTYYLSKEYPSAKRDRNKKESELDKAGKDIEFPGWETLERELTSSEAMLWFTIKDGQGNVIRNLKTSARKGVNRLAWDLRFENTRPINPEQAERSGRWNRGGALVVPGTYSVTLSKEVDGVMTELAGPVSFEVVPLREGSLKASNSDNYLDFVKELNEVQVNYSKLSNGLDKAYKQLKAIRMSLDKSTAKSGQLNKAIFELEQQALVLERELNGFETKNEIGEKNHPSINDYLRFASNGVSSYGPTKLFEESLLTAKNMLEAANVKLELIENALSLIKQELKEAGAPLIL